MISTENVACKLADSVFRYINQKRHIGGFFCNLAKAYYCEKHEILLSEFYGFQGTDIHWFSFYPIENKTAIKIF
jgi:hypothetical protein